MKLSNLLGPEKIILDMRSTGHLEAIQELIDHLVEGGFLAAGIRDECFEALRKREDQVITGVGSGIAIPHAFSGNLDEVVAVMGRSVEGIDFEALDHAPAHFVILFLVPKKQYHLHLRTLAAIAKLFTQSGVRRELAAASTREEILSILDFTPPARNRAPLTIFHDTSAGT